MTRTPILSLLERTGLWQAIPEIAHATDADYPSEDYVTQDVQHHIRRGELILRLRDEATMTFEYGLPEWRALPSPEADTLLDRIQRITRAQWGQAAARREPEAA